MADQDITANIDSRIDPSLYGGASFSAPVDAGAGFVDPRVAVPYTPLADTNVGGISASEYEARAAFARMDADQRAAAVAAARAEETANALRIAAEDPALQRGYFSAPQEMPLYAGRMTDAERESLYGPAYGGYHPPPLAPVGGQAVAPPTGRFDALEIGDGAPGAGLADADPIDPESAASPQYPSYRKARDRQDAITADLRDRFTRDGRYAKIGGDEFARDLQAQMEEAGLAEAPSRLSFRERAAEDKMGIQFGLGFGAMAVDQHVSRYVASTQAGNYVDPGVADAQAGAGVLSGLGAVAGTFGGMMIPGLGSMGGQFVGQAVGDIAGAAWEASAGRQAAVRDTSEQFGGVAGGTTEALERFRDALNEAHAPVKQLTEALGQMMGAGPGVGAGSVGGADLMAGALGGRFGAVTSGMESSLAANPFLAGTLTRFNASGSHLSPGEFGGLAELSALSGDWGGAGSALSEMRGSMASRQYASDRAIDDQINTPAGFLFALEHPGQSIMAQWRLHHGGERDLTPGQQAQLSQEQARVSAAYELSRGTQAGMLTAQSGMGLAGQSLSLGELSGAADVSGLAGGLYASAEGGLSVLGRQEGAINAYLGRGDLTPEMRQAALYQRAGVEDEMGKLRLAEAQTRRALFDRGLQTEESGFSLDETRALYGGQSAAQRAGGVGRQAAYLSGVAADPSSPLTPAERRQLEAQGVSLRFQSAQQQYSQAEAGIGVAQAQAGADLSVARAYGGPGDVYGAQSEQARALLDLQRQLNDEIEKGNLTYDQRLEKTRQVKEITGEVASLESQARNAFFDSSASLLSDSRGADAAGLGRSLAIHGSAGTDFGAVLSDDSREAANARAAMAAARTPEERERWRRTLAGLTEQDAGDFTNSQIWRQGAADQMQDLRATAAFGRAQSAPWADGSDPMSAGRNLLGMREHDLSDLQAWERTHHGDPLADLANARQEEQLRDQIASLRREQTTEAWRMLPEMIAGSPGRGVMAGVLPTSALSAFFTPGAMQGSWGMPGGGGLSPAVPGGAAGHLDMAAGGSEAVSLLRQIADGINRLHGGAAGGRSTPVAPASGQINYFNALGLNR